MFDIIYQILKKNTKIVNLVFGLLVIILVLYTSYIKQEIFQQTDYDFIIIETPCNMSSPDLVELFVTNPIEHELKGISEIENFYSDTTKSMSLIGLQIKHSIPDKQVFTTKLQKKLNDSKILKHLTIKPKVIFLNSGLIPVVRIGIYSRGADLDQHAIKLEKQLRKITAIKDIIRHGVSNSKIDLIINSNKLKHFNVSYSNFISTVAIKIKNYSSIADIKKDTIVIGNKIIPLNNFFKIKKSTKKNRDIIHKVNGQLAIILDVLKKKNTDIIDIKNKVAKIINNYQEKNDSDLNIFIFSDSSYYVEKRNNILKVYGGLGLFFVFIFLFSVIRLRAILVTSVVIVSILLSIIILQLFNINFNLLSIFSIIFALSLIIDNSINGIRSLDTGSHITVKDSYFFKTVPFATGLNLLIMIILFLPLFLFPGIIGDFLFVIPLSMIITLIISWLLGNVFMPFYENEFFQNTTFALNNFFDSYNRVLSRVVQICLNFKWIIFFVLLVFVFSTFLYSCRNIKFVFVPAGEIDRFVIKIKDSPGISLNQMNEKVQDVEKILKNLPKEEILSFYTKVGLNSEQPMDFSLQRGSHIASIIVELTRDPQRHRQFVEIKEDLEIQFYGLQFDEITIVPIRSGPPEGKAINIEITGDDYSILKTIAQKYRKYLASIDGVILDRDNWICIDKHNIVIPDNEKIQSHDDLSKIIIALNSYDLGFHAGQLPTKQGLEKLWIFSSGRYGLENFQKQTVSIMSSGQHAINHANGKRMINISADVISFGHITSFMVLDKLKKKFNTIESDFPGYSVLYKDEFKDIGKSMSSTGLLFLLSILIMVVTCSVFMLSFWRAIIYIIMYFVSFSISFIVLQMHNMPFSFLSMIGMLSVGFIIGNQSLILMKRIKELYNNGLTYNDATLNAVRQRSFMTIILAFTVLLFFLPVCYMQSNPDKLLTSIAIVICWGTFFTLMLLLMIIPALYNLFIIKKK